MAPNYLLAIFHWRDQAGNLDGPHPPASLRTLLYGCDKWLELNTTPLDSDNGRRVLMIKQELEEYLERHSGCGPIDGHRPPSRGADVREL